MADPVESRDAALIAEFRRTRGVITDAPQGVEYLLLTTIGAISGRERVTPLTSWRDGSRFYVFAANGGRATKPGWFHNLLAQPRAQIEVRGVEHPVPVDALVTESSERQRLWDQALPKAPFLPGFQASLPWPIPIVLLTPVPSPTSASESHHA